MRVIFPQESCAYDVGPQLDHVRQLCPPLLDPGLCQGAALDEQQAEVDAGGRGVELVDPGVVGQEDGEDLAPHPDGNQHADQGGHQP